MSRQNQEPDELRARFTVYIKQVIIHAKLDYIRKKNRTSQEISLEDLDFEPAVDFEEQYSQTNSEQKSFEFEEEHLANAFAALPLLRQKVLEMLFVQELTPLEISKSTYMIASSEIPLVRRKLQKSNFRKCSSFIIICLMKRNCH